MSDFIHRPQIEVLSAAESVRRRHWSDEHKLRIVEESFVGHRQVAATARRHGMCRSLLTIWRRQYGNGELGASRPVSFELEMATLGWVDWFNHRRLLGPIGNIPPAEAEENFYAQRDVLDMVA